MEKTSVCLDSECLGFLTSLCFTSGNLSLWKTVYIQRKKPLIALISLLDLISGSQIEDFIAALKAQSITPEITLEKNITSIPLHKGALKISREGKVRRATLLPSCMSAGFSEKSLSEAQRNTGTSKRENRSLTCSMTSVALLVGSQDCSSFVPLWELEKSANAFLQKVLSFSVILLMVPVDTPGLCGPPMALPLSFL